MKDDETTTGPTDEPEVEGHKLHTRREDGTESTDDEVEGHRLHNKRG